MSRPGLEVSQKGHVHLTAISAVDKANKAKSRVGFDCLKPEVRDVR